MNTQERVRKQARAQAGMLGQDHSDPVILVLLVSLVSIMVGLIPFAYASAFGNTQSQTPTTISAGEAGLWSVFGEKENAASGVQE